VQLSTSRKNKKTNKYETDFSGYVAFVGDAYESAKTLKAKDRIKITSCDVSTSYNKEKKVQYTNFTVFSFEKQDGSASESTKSAPTQTKKTAFSDEDDVDDSDVPF
jgi:hypothetical protein